MSKSAANSKADTAVKLVLIFFISLLSFSVGTYVGKQVSDSDSHRAALEADYSGAQEPVAKNEAATSDIDEATAPISDEEVSSLTEEFVQSERAVASEGSGEAHANTSAPAAHEKDADGYTHRSKMKAENHEAAMAAKPAVAEAKSAAMEAKPAHASPEAERVAHDMAPAPDQKKARTPTAVLPSVATTAIGKYTVQVASFATELEAKEQAAKLTSKGYSAFYVPANVNGKAWYRVSVGLFSDQKSATNYRTELLATKTVTSAIVQKIVK